jgi:Flp pilus assembly protein TadB
MAHWPRSARTYLLAIPLVILAGVILVQLFVALSGTVVWLSVAVIAVVSVTYSLVTRRLHAAQDRAVADAPSFADALNRGHAAEAVELPS